MSGTKRHPGIKSNRDKGVFYKLVDKIHFKTSVPPKDGWSQKFDEIHPGVTSSV